MILLSLIVIISLGLLYLIARFLKKNKDEHTRDILKHLSILELSIAALSIMLGLFLLFELIEKSTMADFYSYRPELILITTSFVLGILHFGLFSILAVRLFRN